MREEIRNRNVRMERLGCLSVAGYILPSILISLFLLFLIKIVTPENVGHYAFPL